MQDSGVVYKLAIPPVRAYGGQACYNCFKGRDPLDNPLKRCNGCLRVYYCGMVCEKADWNRHRDICRAFQAVEKEKGQELLALFLPFDDKTRNVDQIDVANDALSTILIKSLEEKLKRPLWQSEINLIVSGPRCLCCGRSDAIFRLEATLNNQPSKAEYTTGLKPCRDCHLVFFCSRKHRKLTKDAHHQIDHPSLRTSMYFQFKSHCAINQLCIEDSAFREGLHKYGVSEELNFVPGRTVLVYKPLGNEGDWEGEYTEHIKNRWAIPQHTAVKSTHDILRCISECLSMPMTILWALEILQKDKAWTKKETLNIHVLGYDVNKLFDTLSFEEIMHRLPLVKTLKLTFCSLIHKDSFHLNLDPTDSGTTTCHECSENGRKIIHSFHPKHYHDYVCEQESKGTYIKPDLVVAFHGEIGNVKLSEVWAETLNTLVKLRIPSVFTSYNETEASIELGMLLRSGANVHGLLACKPNPWGSLRMRPEPNRVFGFYSTNAWICGFA